jgi:hypothetical protein
MTPFCRYTIFEAYRLYKLRLVIDSVALQMVLC